MTLQRFRDLLVDGLPGIPVRHLEAASGDETPVLIWTELGCLPVRVGGNATGVRKWHIQLDYYTKSEFDETADRIAAVLDANDVAFSGDARIYDADTGETRYIFDCYMLRSGE